MSGFSPNGYIFNASLRRACQKQKRPTRTAGRCNAVIVNVYGMYHTMFVAEFPLLSIV